MGSDSSRAVVIEATKGIDNKGRDDGERQRRDVRRRWVVRPLESEEKVVEGFLVVHDGVLCCDRPELVQVKEMDERKSVIVRCGGEMNRKSKKV